MGWPGIRPIYKAESLDVAVGAGLQRGDDVVAALGLEEMGVAALDAEVLLDRHLPADLRHTRHVPGLGLEDREHTALLGEPCDVDGLARLAAPAQRAGHEHVDVA